MWPEMCFYRHRVTDSAMQFVRTVYLLAFYPLFAFQLSQGLVITAKSHRSSQYGSTALLSLYFLRSLTLAFGLLFRSLSGTFSRQPFPLLIRTVGHAATPKYAHNAHPFLFVRFSIPAAALAHQPAP